MTIHQFAVLPLPVVILMLALLLFLVLTANGREDARRTRQPSRGCPDCNATHPPHANYCPRCGKGLV